MHKITRRFLSLLCLCSLLLTGCHSLFSGNTTVLLPEQEMLLPAARYAYTNELIENKFVSTLDNAFKVDDRAIGDMIAFECLDFLEESNEFVYYYQTILADDVYTAAYDAYAEELAVYSDNPDSVYYRMYHKPGYDAIMEAYKEISLEFMGLMTAFEFQYAPQPIYTQESYEASRQGYTASLIVYEEQLQLYIEKYWPGTFQSVLTEQDYRNAEGAWWSPQMPMEPPEPEPQPPEPPPVSLSSLMLTHMAAYNWETGEIRDFFVQETGPNAEQTAYAHKIADTDNYMLYFGGQTYFYEPDGTCYLQVNFQHQLERVDAALRSATGAVNVTVTNVVPFSGGSEIYMYLLVELENIDENTGMLGGSEDDKTLYASIQCSLAAFEETLVRSSDGSLGVNVNGTSDYYIWGGTGIPLVYLSDPTTTVKRADLYDDASFGDLGVAVADVKASMGESYLNDVFSDDITDIMGSTDEQTPATQVRERLADRDIASSTVALGGFVELEPIYDLEEIVDPEGNSYNPKQYERVVSGANVLLNGAFQATFTTHLSGPEALETVPLTGDARVTPDGAQIVWEGVVGTADSSSDSEQAQTELVYATRTEGLRYVSGTYYAVARDENGSAIVDENDNVVYETEPSYQYADDTIFSAGNLPLPAGSRYRGTFGVFAEKHIYIFYYGFDPYRSTAINWYHVQLPMEYLHVNTGYDEEEESSDSYGMRDFLGQTEYDIPTSSEEVNPDTYDNKNVLALSEHDFIITSLYNGLIRLYWAQGYTGLQAEQLLDVPLYQIWQRSDGSYLGIGFDTAGKQYTPADLPKARVITFELELSPSLVWEP